RQRHPRGGHPRSPRGGPAPAADGARRRGRDGRRRRHRAALGGDRRLRGDLPGAAGGGGRGRRQEQPQSHPAALCGVLGPSGGGEAARRGESFGDCERQRRQHSVGRCKKPRPRRDCNNVGARSLKLQ
ncbi:unnamed protein product, partial [Cladocopium goreaui]